MVDFSQRLRRLDGVARRVRHGAVILQRCRHPARDVVRAGNAPDGLSDLQALLGVDVPHAVVGQTAKEPRLRVAGADGEWRIWSPLAALKEAWQKPLAG